MNLLSSSQRSMRDAVAAAPFHIPYVSCAFSIANKAPLSPPAPRASVSYISLHSAVTLGKNFFSSVQENHTTAKVTRNQSQCSARGATPLSSRWHASRSLAAADQPSPSDTLEVVNGSAPIRYLSQHHKICPRPARPRFLFEGSDPQTKPVLLPKKGPVGLSGKEISRSSTALPPSGMPR